MDALEMELTVVGEVDASARKEQADAGMGLQLGVVAVVRQGTTSSDGVVAAGMQIEEEERHRRADRFRTVGVKDTLAMDIRDKVA